MICKFSLSIHTDIMYLSSLSVVILSNLNVTDSHFVTSPILAHISPSVFPETRDDFSQN